MDEEPKSEAGTRKDGAISSPAHFDVGIRADPGGGCVVEAAASATDTYLILTWPRSLEQADAQRVCESIAEALSPTGQDAAGVEKYTLHFVMELWPRLEQEQRLLFLVYARRELGLADFGDGLWALGAGSETGREAGPSSNGYRHFRMIDTMRLRIWPPADGRHSFELSAVPAGPTLLAGLPFAIDEATANRVRLVMLAALIEQDGFESMADSRLLRALADLWPRLAEHARQAICVIARESCGYDDTGNLLVPNE